MNHSEPSRVHELAWKKRDRSSDRLVPPAFALLCQSALVPPVSVGVTAPP